MLKRDMEPLGLSNEGAAILRDALRDLVAGLEERGTFAPTELEAVRLIRHGTRDSDLSSQGTGQSGQA